MFVVMSPFVLPLLSEASWCAPYGATTEAELLPAITKCSLCLPLSNLCLNNSYFLLKIRKSVENFKVRIAERRRIADY